GFERDSIGAAEHREKVDVYLRNSKAEIRGAPGQMGNPGGGDGSFGGCAAEVDARSSEIFALGQRDLLSRFREIASQGRPGLPASDDQDVILIGHFLLVSRASGWELGTQRIHRSANDGHLIAARYDFK